MSFFDLPAADLDALANAQPAQPPIQAELDDYGDAAARVVFVAGIPHGLMSVFHRAGVPAMEAGYHHGVSHAAMPLYDEKGRVLREAQREAGLAEDERRTYYPSAKVMHE